MRNYWLEQFYVGFFLWLTGAVTMLIWHLLKFLYNKILLLYDFLVLLFT